jgi:hypothetical protein
MSDDLAWFLEKCQDHRYSDEFLGNALRSSIVHLVVADSELRDALWQCFLVSGSDPDGMKSPPLEVARWAVDAVKSLRKDYDDALEELP